MLAPVRERYEELRGDEAALQDSSPRRREGARDRRADVADVREAMGVGRRAHD